MEKRTDLIFMARVTEKTRRFDQMFAIMKKVVTNFKDQLNNQERSLLAASFKNSATQRKMAMRDCNQIQKIEEKQKRQDLTPLRQFKAKLVDEMLIISKDMVNLIQSYLLKNCRSAQGQIGILKIRADAYKFIYDGSTGEDKKKAAKLAHQSYQMAYQKACGHLKSTHPVRLGLALSFSVFYDGVYGDLIQACTIAKKAFDQGTRDLKQNDKQFYQDSSAILQMLRDNLTFWTNELQKQT